MELIIKIHYLAIHNSLSIKLYQYVLSKNGIFRNNYKYSNKLYILGSLPVISNISNLHHYKESRRFAFRVVLIIVWLNHRANEIKPNRMRHVQLCDTFEVVVYHNFLGSFEGLSSTLDTLLAITTVFYSDLPCALQTFWRPVSLISYSGKWIPRDFLPAHVYLTYR